MRRLRRWKGGRVWRWRSEAFERASRRLAVAGFLVVLASPKFPRVGDEEGGAAEVLVEVKFIAEAADGAQFWPLPAIAAWRRRRRRDPRVGALPVLVGHAGPVAARPAHGKGLAGALHAVVRIAHAALLLLTGLERRRAEVFARRRRRVQRRGRRRRQRHWRGQPSLWALPSFQGARISLARLRLAHGKCLAFALIAELAIRRTALELSAILVVVVAWRARRKRRRRRRGRRRWSRLPAGAKPVCGVLAV